jgi:hypothetical protein
MSIYNINNLIGKSKIQALKKFLNTDKITVCYSDWGNVFGIKTYKKDIDKTKHILAVKYVSEHLKDMLISNLTKCPKIIINKDY